MLKTVIFLEGFSKALVFKNFLQLLLIFIVFPSFRKEKNNIKNIKKFTVH